MDRRSCLAILPLAAASFASGAAATAVPRSMIRLRKPGQELVSCRLEELGWLTGRWIGQMSFGPVEIVKLPIAHGQLPTFVRAMNNDGIMFYEITAFVQTGDKIVQRLKHFTSKFEGWEEKSVALERPLLEWHDQTWFFDGSTIQRTGADSYVVYHLNRDGEKELDTLVVPFRRVAF